MKEVPDIDEYSGISNEYWWLEYFPITETFNLSGILGVSEFIKRRPIKQYEQLFPSSEFKNAVTPQNSESVKKLDDLAKKANTLFADHTTFTNEEYKEHMNSVYHIISAIETMDIYSSDDFLHYTK